MYPTENLETAIRAFAMKYLQVKANPQALEALLSVRNQSNGSIVLTVFHLVDICWPEGDQNPAL